MRDRVILAVLISAVALAGLFWQQMQSEQTTPTDVPNCGLTDDFNSFLQNNGYSSYGFNRTDIKCGSFGGRENSSQKINKIPVIFIHDNEDVAYGRGTVDGKKSLIAGYQGWQTGFRQLAKYLIANNYTSAELYTTTYGSGRQLDGNNNYHSKEFLMRLRKFVEAVLAYTGSKQVNVISHGMGVTLARKVVKGGACNDHQAGYYDVGPSISKLVNAFIGIAGYNLGLASCVPEFVFPVCSNRDGFFPGTIVGTGLSEYITNLNSQGGTEGTNVWSIWSADDEITGPGSLVFNRVTCRIPGQNGEVKKSTLEWNHNYLRDNSGPDILPLLG